jgi:hypothetical protein
VSDTKAHRISSAKDVHAGDAVWISPAAGVHGWGSGWHMVVKTSPALVEGAVYVHAAPLDDIDGASPVRVFYCRVSGLLVRRLA